MVIRFRRAFVLAVVLSVVVALWAQGTPAQELPTLRVGSISGPLVNPIIWNIMKAQGIDKKHGFALDIHLYPSITAFYGGFSTGEVDAIMGGPSIFAKLRNQGVPLKIVATTLTLADLSVFARDPAVKSLTDLRGKQLAVDTGGSQYQIMSIYARSKGLDLAKDVSLVDANFALSRAQLVAERVDAAMIPEPLSTMLIEENPNLKIIFNGNAGWKALTGHDGWENVAAMREEAIKRTPNAPAQLIAALQETTAWIRGNLGSADQIVVDTVKLPPGVFKDAIMSKRLDFNVQPAWTAQRAVISDMFRRAVAAGFGDKTPDDGIFYAP